MLSFGPSIFIPGTPWSRQTWVPTELWALSVSVSDSPLQLNLFHRVCRLPLICKCAILIDFSYLWTLFCCIFGEESVEQIDSAEELVLLLWLLWYNGGEWLILSLLGLNVQINYAQVQRLALAEVGHKPLKVSSLDHFNVCYCIREGYVHTTVLEVVSIWFLLDIGVIAGRLLRVELVLLILLLCLLLIYTWT